MLTTHLALFAALTASACTSDNEGQASSELSGSAAFRDATTDHAGAPTEPAKPAPQSAHVSMVIKGTGQIPNIDPHCALDPAGAFEAHYLSTLNMSNDSVYAATIAGGSGAIQTPSGCAVPDLTVGVITDIVVRGELSINTTNCETYCGARARAEAESQCGATASSAECRTSYETTASAQCTQTCTTKASKIVAEVSLAASLLGDIDADALRAAAFGDLAADLTFDQLVDADGKRL